LVYVEGRVENGLDDVQSTIKLALSFLFLLLGIFVLPFVFPHDTSILSASTLAGFNNSMAYAWFVVVLGLPIYVLANTLPLTTVVLHPPETGRLSLVPTKTVLVTILCHLFLFGALYTYKQGFVFSEALYFEDLIYRMSMGAVPFIDVHFFYGPVLLYPAAFLSRLVSVEAAYAIYYVAVYVAGLYILFVVLIWLMPVREDANRWFLIFAFGFFNPYTGLNYTFVRHLLPVVTLLAAWWYARSVGGVRMAVVMALVLLSLTYSPEIGLVTVASLGAFSLLWIARVKPKERWGFIIAAHLGPLFLALVMLGVVFYCIDPSWRALENYANPVLKFSSGGWNTPIDPSLPMLTMIMLTVVTGAIGLQVLRQQAWSEASSWLMTYGLMVILMQRAAFGKADVAHIAYSGLPLYVISARLGLSYANRAISCKGLRWLLIAGLIVPLQLYHAMQYTPFVEKYFVPSPPRHGDQNSASARPNKEVIQAGIVGAVDHFGRDKLYYMHKLEYYRLPVYTRLHLKPVLYYPSLTSAFTQEDIQEVIRGLRTANAIVIALRRDLGEEAHSQGGGRHWLHYMMSSPLPGSSVFDLTMQFQAKLEVPLMEFLKSSYEVQFEDGEVLALVPRKL
jgi:hypothetical protein